MTPADLQQLLLAHLPSVTGVESAVPWPDRPYGLAVTAAGAGTVYWMVSGASGVVPLGEAGEHLAPGALPEPSGGKVATAWVEQALVTALAAGDVERHVLRASRYSTRPVAPAVGYGVTVDCTDGWRLFVACIGTARRGETLRGSRHFHPDSDV
jgi:hypothetical protein